MIIKYTILLILFGMNVSADIGDEYLCKKTQNFFISDHEKISYDLNEFIFKRDLKKLYYFDDEKKISREIPLEFNHYLNEEFFSFQTKEINLILKYYDGDYMLIEVIGANSIFFVTARCEVLR